MRIHVQFQVSRPAAIPVNHQHALMSLVYRLLGASSAEYAAFLHEEGYGLEGGDSRRLKLFVFSWLRAPRSRREVRGEMLHLSPGTVDWFISSPLEAFLVHGATGLLSVGAQVRVCDVPFEICAVRALPAPRFAESMAFTCLTPVVASARDEEGRCHYYRAWEGGAFSEAVRRNLLRKHEIVYGRPPDDSRLQLEWSAAYLERDPHCGQKKMRFKGIDVIGVQAPLVLRGNPALIQLAYETGLGEKNAAGFGMIEATHG